MPAPFRRTDRSHGKDCIEFIVHSLIRGLIGQNLAGQIVGPQLYCQNIFITVRVDPLAFPNESANQAIMVFNSAFLAGCMQNDVAKAMADTVGSGVESFENEQMQVVAFIPQLLQAMSGNLISADSADGFGGGTVSVSVTFQISGDASSETVNALQDYGDDFAERVLEVIAEAEEDSRRRAYR